MKLHPTYTVVTLAYLIGIFILSQIPGSDSAQGGIYILPERLQNFLHIPLFAGLAWCMLMSLTDGQWKKTAPLWCYCIVGCLSIFYAASDEWHQAFVPSRFPSVGDFFMDCVGIMGLLLIHRLSSNPNTPSKRSPAASVYEGAS